MKDQLRVIQRLWGIGGACWSLGEILLTDTGSTVLTLMGLPKQVTPTLQALLGSVFCAAAAAALLWAGLLGTGRALSGVSQRVSLLVRRTWLKYRGYLRSIFRTAVVSIGVCATLTAATFILIAVSANTDRPAFVYATQPGQRGIVRIGNAVITLTPETEIAVSGTLASVWLKHGEAEISMRHDPRHPITIMVDDLAVCDVGTRFSVRREAGRTIVSVLEGSVQLGCHRTGGIHEWLASMFRSAPPIVPVTLNAGAKAEVPERSPDAHFIESRLSQFEIAKTNAIETGVLDLPSGLDVPLSDVIRELNRYRSRKIVIDDPGISSKGISGRYFLQDQRSLRGVEQHFRLQEQPDPRDSSLIHLVQPRAAARGR